MLVGVADSRGTIYNPQGLDAATKGILPRKAAVDLAVQRLKKSMSYIIDAGRCFRQRLGSYSKTQRFANGSHATVWCC
jgi:hypothetical protein